VVYHSPTGRLQEMEAPVAAIVVWLGLARSVRLAVLFQFVAPVVLGVSPMDEWRSVPFGESSMPYRAGDHCDATLVVFFFSSLLLPLMAR
jgi:hypothetical protein